MHDRRLAAVVVWVAGAWLAAAVFGGAAIGSALADNSRPVQLVGTVGAWVGFAAGAVALVVPAVVTLTAARAIVPASVAVCAVCVIGDADGGDLAALLAAVTIATAAVATAEFGRGHLQASAYGDERRFGLRPPIGYLVAVAVTWLLTVSATIVAALGLAGRAWAVAIPAVLVAAAGWWLGPRRWHQLSRRWFVLVPAGVVVHDPVVLAETLMAPRQLVDTVTLDELGVTSVPALDLTGPTPGLRVEVTVRQPLAVVIAPTSRGGEAQAITVGAFVISPTRPGAAVGAAANAGLGR